jgi:hypothetical protein
MRSTLARPLAAAVAGAALILVPMSASAEPFPNPIDVEDPFSVESLPNEPEYNNEDNWTLWLTEIGAPGVECTKYENPVATPFVVPLYPSETEEWALAVVKSGSDQSTESPNDLVWFPFPEEELFHSSEREISHVILCSALVEEETTPPTTPVTSTTTTSTTTTSTTTTGTTTTTTPVTGPVVETDRPAGGDMSQVGLFAGAAALLAGATALVLGRRRQSADH